MSTTSSYFGEFMKLSTEMWTASGLCRRARSVSWFCVMTRSAVSSRFAIALLVTVTSSMPAFLILLRRTLAPMAEDPMPASQANTIVRTGLVTTVPPSARPPVSASVSSRSTVSFAVRAAPASEPEEARSASIAADDLPLFRSVCAIAAPNSSPSASRSRLRVARRMTAVTRNVTAAASTTDR